MFLVLEKSDKTKKRYGNYKNDNFHNNITQKRRILFLNLQNIVHPKQIKSSSKKLSFNSKQKNIFLQKTFAFGQKIRWIFKLETFSYGGKNNLFFILQTFLINSCLIKKVIIFWDFHNLSSVFKTLWALWADMN